MKAQFFQIVKTGEATFLVEEDKLESFYGLLHYHPEIQITLILSGSGLRIIGGQVLPFSPGTLMIIGENQPHVFKNNPVAAGQYVEAISIYFKPAAFGQGFFQLPEVRLINNFLNSSKAGYDVAGNTRTYLEDQIMRLPKLSGFASLTRFLQILDTLASSADLTVLSPDPLELVGKDMDADRLNRIFNYVLSHLQDEIRLDEIASVAHLSPNGFCRFFKKKTRKSFFHFLVETRISKSMELLREKDWTISRCAFESGFGNLSYYNREFLKHAGITPRQYRRQFIG